MVKLYRKILTLDITQTELDNIAKPNTSVTDHAIVALCNLYKVEIVVLLTNAAVHKQIYGPSNITGEVVPSYQLYFNLSGHYDALLPINRRVQKTALNRGDKCLLETKKRKRADEPSSNAKTKSKKQKTEPQKFQDLPLSTRQDMILGWLGISVASVDSVIEECDVETKPECISSCILDECVNLADVKGRFSEDAWTCLEETLKVKQTTCVWVCDVCTEPFAKDQRSIVCEHCLLWKHFKCVGVKRASKKNSWFCSQCKTSK